VDRFEHDFDQERALLRSNMIDASSSELAIDSLGAIFAKKIGVRRLEECVKLLGEVGEGTPLPVSLRIRRSVGWRRHRVASPGGGSIGRGRTIGKLQATVHPALATPAAKQGRRVPCYP